MRTGIVDENILRYAVGWNEAIMPRTIIALLGGLVLILTIRTIWKRDCSFLAGLLWLVAGAVMLAFSFYPQEIINSVIRTEYLTRIRMIMGGVSVIVLLVTFESIRRTHLQERYALLWVATALVVLLCAFLPDAVALFRAVTGMEYATAMVAVAFTFLVLVAFHFSIAMSAMQSDQSKLAQRIAILEARLRRLEEKAGEGEKRKT